MAVPEPFGIGELWPEFNVLLSKKLTGFVGRWCWGLPAGLPHKLQTGGNFVVVVSGGHGVVGVLDNGLGPGHLDDVLSTDWDWDGHVVWLLDVEGASLKGSGYSDVDLGDHWLEGLVVVSGDVGLSAVVDLLGHLLGWLVD